MSDYYNRTINIQPYAPEKNLSWNRWALLSFGGILAIILLDVILWGFTGPLFVYASFIPLIFGIVALRQLHTFKEYGKVFAWLGIAGSVLYPLFWFVGLILLAGSSSY